MEKSINIVEARKEFEQLKQTLHEALETGKTDPWKLQQSIGLTRQLLRDIDGKRNTKGDRLQMSDYVVAYYGTPKTPLSERVMIFASKGHIVGQALSGVRGRLADVQSGTSYGYGGSVNWATKVTYMRVGTGTGVTTNGTTNLSAINATPPDAQSILSTDPAGTYRVAWTATWNAGTLAAITITEIGLWLNISPLISGSTVSMFSRLSEDDGDFVAFLVNIAVPLTIEWRLTLSFA